LSESSTVRKSWITIDTPLGSMLAIADKEMLYLLEFVDRKGLERGVERFKKTTKSEIIAGYTQPIRSIEAELKSYFEGLLIEFKTPLFIFGSPFQKRVWEELKKIPSGETRSYSEIATAMGQPTAFRAVANANGANRIALVIPCHRVINADGELGGYAAGVARKKWLINHEKQRVSTTH